MKKRFAYGIRATLMPRTTSLTKAAGLRIEPDPRVHISMDLGYPGGAKTGYCIARHNEDGTFTVLSSGETK